MEERKGKLIVEPKLIWLDLETTGLDPFSGDILEVGIIITDLDLNEQARLSWIFQHDRDYILSSMDDYVLNMHLASGLLKEVWGEQKQNETLDCFRLRLDADKLETWKAVCDWIAVKAPGAYASRHLAGSSVHFDRSWLGANIGAEEILKMVSHQQGDVTSFKIFFPGLLSQSEKKVTHRALADLDYSIDQLRQMRQMLGLAPMAAPDMEKTYNFVPCPEGEGTVGIITDKDIEGLDHIERIF